MHVELDITGSRLSYVAGDHMALFPVNNPQDVESIGRLLGVDLDTVFSLQVIDSNYSWSASFLITVITIGRVLNA